MAGCIGSLQGMYIQQAFLSQRISKEPRHDKDKYGQYFYKSAEQRADAGVVFIFGSQDSLYDRLVGTPVPDAQNGVTQKNGIPGKAAAIAMRTQHRQFLHMMGLLQGSHHGMPAAHFHKAGDGNDDGAGYQHDGLDALRDHYGPQSPNNGIDGRYDRDDGDAGVHIDAEKRLQHNSPGEQGEGDMDDDRRKNGYKGEPVAAGTVIPALQEIRERTDTARDIKGRKEQGQQDQDKGGHPFEVAAEQTCVEAALRQAYQMQTGDIGGKEGQPNHWPAQSLARQEIVVGRAARWVTGSSAEPCRAVGRPPPASFDCRSLVVWNVTSLRQTINDWPSARPPPASFEARPQAHGDNTEDIQNTYNNIGCLYHCPED